MSTEPLGRVVAGKLYRGSPECFERGSRADCAVTALILQPDGMEVATVDASHHVHMAHVVPGRDFGNTVEILSGLTAGQSIVSIPPDSLTDGEAVRVVNAGSKPGQAQVAETKR